MSADDRKVWLHEQIRKWVGEKRIEECLSALELGNLSMTEKAVAYRSVLIIGGIKHCRMHKRVEARIPILTLITYLSDNAKGTCFLSIAKMAALFDRSRQCIIDNILALEGDGLIGAARVDGMLNCYWPRIPAALKDMSPNPAWVIEVLTTPKKARIFGSINKAIAAAIHQSGNQSSTVDQSSGLDGYQSIELDHNRSSGVDPTSQVQPGNQSSLAGVPVKSSTDSISSLHLTPSQGERSGCNLSANEGDFVISAKDGIVIPAETVGQWRARFPALRDLDANMQRLASVILRKGIMHPGWTNPAAWMVGALAQDNQRAADASREAEAKLAAIQRGQPAKTFRR